MNDVLREARLFLRLRAALAAVLGLFLLAAAGTAAGITAILAYPIPFRLGLLVAVAAGIAAGIAWERWTR